MLLPPPATHLRLCLRLRVLTVARSVRACQFKVLLGFYMLAAPIPDVYDVSLPEDVEQLLRSMTVVVTLGINAGLEATPLNCLGLGGIVAQIQFWTFIPLVVVLVILGASTVVAVWRAGEDKDLKLWKRVLTIAAPSALKFLFIMFPIVSREAFKAFPCYDLGEYGSVLRADVALECGDSSASGSAMVAILLYPVGLFLLFGA